MKARTGTPTKAKAVTESSIKKALRPGTKAGLGNRPKFDPTQDQRNLVILGMGLGMTVHQICSLIINPATGKPIGKDTLNEHFADELETGEARVMARVGGNLINIASDKQHKGCVTAAIFWLKMRARWREPEPEWVERRRSFEAEKVTTADGFEERITFTLTLEEPKEPTPVIDATATAA